MRVLGLESSCDETAAAVVDDGPTLVSNVVHTQLLAHTPYGGVVPEIASREHLRHIIPVIEAATAPSGGLSSLEGIAATQGPGLLGALLVGLQVAKGLALALDLPFVGVNHLEGHLCAARLDPEFEGGAHVAALISGGHTQLYACEEDDTFTLLASTRDDAAGEACDKVAKLLGLGFPGGPALERCGRGGDPTRFAVPRVLMHDAAALSFSGLKSFAAQWLRQLGRAPEPDELRDFCASFEQAIAETLVTKAIDWAKRRKLGGIALGGGVAANTRLRAHLQERCQAAGLWSYAPPKPLCTDNAAMIAVAGQRRLVRGERSPFEASARSRWPLCEALVREVA